MPKYEIIYSNPYKYKDVIFDFWDRYLPGTPHARLDWLMNGNPAGPAWWLFAFSETEGEIVGIVSLMPRILYLNGEPIRVGIMGDLMISDKHRVFGPALPLVREISRSYQKLDFGFVYTVPNSDSKKLIQKAGFEEVLSLISLLRPVEISYYLKKKLPKPFILLYLPFLTFAMKISSRDQYSNTKNIIEFSKIGASFDSLNQSLRGSRQLIGDRSSSLLKWHYLSNPYIKFRIFGYKNSSGELYGYVAFAIENRKLEVYDLIAKHRKALLSLLHAINSEAREKHCLGIYISTSKRDYTYKILRSCAFFDAKDTISVFTHGQTEVVSNWVFFSGDRNI